MANKKKGASRPKQSFPRNPVRTRPAKDTMPPPLTMSIDDPARPPVSLPDAPGPFELPFEAAANQVMVDMRGLHGAYWFSVIELHRPPVLRDLIALVIGSLQANQVQVRETRYEARGDAVVDVHMRAQRGDGHVLVVRAFGQTSEYDDNLAQRIARLLNEEDAKLLAMGVTPGGRNG